MNKTLWQTKLAARIHDPAEKALVLLRDPAGHEGGSIVAIGRALGFETRWVTRRDGSKVEKLKLPEEIDHIVEQADHWAAGADRAQFPKDANERYPAWAQVRFAEKGEIRHPLTGHVFPVHGIGQDVLSEHIKAVSGDAFRNLIQTAPDGAPDFYRTLLAFWRFGPELGRNLKGIGHLWSLLPADTRTPDHTIWQHLDLTSAIAGAMCDGQRPALLAVSLGPVQEFIAAGRSTSDLWAGSHFLSTLAWQAMKVVAEALQPDAILFPQLRAVPIVDLWLKEQGLQAGLFEHCEWNDRDTDYNPLFGAALPNKFVAVVSEDEGERLANEIRSRVRNWVRTEARAMLDRVMREIGETPKGQHCYTQLDDQLCDFPEVHWSLAPWLPEGELEPALATFYPTDVKRPGFFGTETWEILKARIQPQQEWSFWEPNDGTLYPAVHDAVERSLAAAKSVRSFGQLPQQGYRDSLSGEYEWLTLDEKHLALSSGQRKETQTLWMRAARERPSWAKKGEHLSAYGLIKRLWPTHYTEWLKTQGIAADASRYVVSTHAMALAPSLEKLIRVGPADEQAFGELELRTANVTRAALPRRLMSKKMRENEAWWRVATRLPALIEDLRERAESGQEEGQIESVNASIEKAIGAKPERYYALILMDGDRLGAWLSGENENTLRFCESFHSSVRAGLDSYGDDRLKRYLNLNRPTSPARHMAISSALNGFSIDLVRHVVEDQCLGKLLYSGGDDVMAMVCVRDLLKALWLLRLVYSGGMAGEAGTALFDHDVDVGRGFLRWKNGKRDQLYRVMGERATASVGAVIAHYMAPLSAVLRGLREAEKEAKSKGGRNAFSIRVIKRSGGRLDLTLPWWLCEDQEITSGMHALESLRAAIAGDMSRRVAYHADEWVRRFPLIEEATVLVELIARNLQEQFRRKARAGAKLDANQAECIARVAVREASRRLGSRNEAGTLAREAYTVVQGLLFTAEFLARESRGGEKPAEEETEMEANHA